MAKSTKPASGVGTRLVRLGREKDLTGDFVNPPLVRASTVLFDSAEDMLSGRARYTYARRGTPTLDALSGALSDLDGAAGTVLCPSGLSAISTAILAFASSGDHVLIPDSVYGPTRTLAADVLDGLGISVSYYDPTVGAGIAAAMRPETRVVYVESPGSNTMEMQDIPAIAEVAHRGGATVIADNTWATPLFCRPIALGADVVLLAGTKYVGGHADIMLGSVSANEACWNRLRRFHGAMGLCAGPDDVWLALRGLRTLEVRLRQHEASALRVATWLAERRGVDQVLHPALPGDAGHAIWQRDMSGSTGLFAFTLSGRSEGDARAFLDALEFFGLGYSWGGFESLAVLGSHRLERSLDRPGGNDPLIRLHIGLEDPSDLIADLDQALSRVS